MWVTPLFSKDLGSGLCRRQAVSRNLLKDGIGEPLTFGLIPFHSRDQGCCT